MTTDTTTEGYAATDAEIDGMVRNLCAYALSEPDPLQRYVDLTHQQVLFEGIVAAIRRARGRALADLLVAGTPLAEVATTTNLATPAKVRKLVSLAGETERVAAATPRKTKAGRSAAPPAVAAVVTAAESMPDQPTGAPPSLPAQPSVPDSPAPALVAPTGKRVLTAADRLALGLPVEGAIPRVGLDVAGAAPAPSRRLRSALPGRRRRTAPAPG